jgi:beta-mannosidase
LPTSKADWKLWEYHNFQRKETLEIAKVPQGKTLEQFISNTQHYQAQLTQLAAESYRRQAYQPVGSLFQFMLVENWPSMNWAVVDFWRKPKPAYYALQRAYQPVLPSLAWNKVNYAAGEPVTVGAWALNDSLAHLPNAQYRLTLWQGRQQRDTQRWSFELAPDSHRHLRDYTVPVQQPGKYRLAAEITDAQGKVISRNEYRFTIQSQ